MLLSWHYNLISILLYCHTLEHSNGKVMGRFSVGDNYVIKKVQKIKDYCYVFFSYVVENGVNDGAGQGRKITRDIRISKLNIFFSLFVLNCQIL